MKSCCRHLRIVARGVAFFVIIGTAYFFAKEITENWMSLRGAGLHVHAGGIGAAFGLVVASGLLITLAWHCGIAAYPATRKTSLLESFAIVNTTQFTKYLPGKIWSYALQMFLMESRGIPKSYVLYVNILIALSGVLQNSFCAPLFMILYSTRLPHAVLGLTMCIMATGYGGFVLCNGTVVAYGIKIANRILKKEMVFYELPLAVLLKIQALVLVMNAAFAAAGCAACYGIGFAHWADMVVPVSMCVLLSDTLGFIILLAPAGLGVREGTMFVLLNGVLGKNIALLLPLVLRTISMSSDFVLGAIALVLYRKYVVKPTQAGLPTQHHSRVPVQHKGSGGRVSAGLGNE